MERVILCHAARLAAERPCGKFPCPVRDRELPAPVCRSCVQDDERLLAGHGARKGVYVRRVVGQYGLAREVVVVVDEIDLYAGCGDGRDLDDELVVVVVIAMRQPGSFGPLRPTSSP